MEVPLPTSPQPHIDKMSNTGLVKIVKPRESQIKVSEEQRVSNIKRYLKEADSKDNAHLPSMKPVFASLKHIS